MKTDEKKKITEEEKQQALETLLQYARETGRPIAVIDGNVPLLLTGGEAAGWVARFETFAKRLRRAEGLQ